MIETQEVTLKYHRRHKLPITLCKPGRKQPYAEGWPQKRYTIREINQEFRTYGNLNVGCVWGPRSKLVDIEYDVFGGDRELLDLFDGNVPVTPTWLSKRSPHRVFQWHPNLEQIGKATFTCGKLEIRIGANCKGAHSLLPPSTTDRFTRRWQVSLEDCDPAPLPDSVVRRLLLSAKPTKSTKRALGGGGDRVAGMGTQKTQKSHEISVSTVYHSPNSTSSPPTNAVQSAITATLPTTSGRRHHCLFNFARHLKAIPSLANEDAEALRPYVEWWHELALSVIATKEFEETWFDFRNAWESVKFAAGEEPIAIMYSKAMSRKPPKCADMYQQAQLKALVALCRELQRTAGDEPFYLAGRIAAEQIAVDHKTAARWLKMLCMDRVLELAEPGSRHRASEYRYRGD